MTPQQYADRLLPLALALAAATRDQSPNAINTALEDIRATPAPHGADPITAVAVFLAAGINPDATPYELWGWTAPALPIDEWSDRAACLNHDPDIFYPTNLAGVRTAQAICDICPVRALCRAYATHPDTYERYGIWGGTSERERERIHEQHKKAQAAA